MKYIKFIIVGMIFGIIMYKSEAVSWYRIYEMFRFESFHMYGIIGSALFVGIIGIQLMKFTNAKSTDGKPIDIKPKEKGIWRYLLGGTVFGLGWALAGTCPGPIFVLIGSGAYTVSVVLLGALIGTIIYGLERKNLPH